LYVFVGRISYMKLYPF